MKEILLMYAKYTQRANASVMTALDGLPLEAINESRKGYRKSLAALASHAFGCALYFHGVFRAALPAAKAALKATEGLGFPEREKLTADEWSAMKKACAIADQATVDLVQALSEEELAHPIETKWYGGKPPAVPLCFFLHQVYVHGVHHRGQISQILDEMGVENDYSGIDVEFLPR
jgi:uncharacterized damage-inducible protein DinB